MAKSAGQVSHRLSAEIEIEIRKLGETEKGGKMSQVHGMNLHLDIPVKLQWMAPKF